MYIYFNPSISVKKYYFENIYGLRRKKKYVQVFQLENYINTYRRILIYTKIKNNKYKCLIFAFHPQLKNVLNMFKMKIYREYPLKILHFWR